MAALMPQGKQQYFTAGGIPLVGGKVYTYAAGTTTPLATYTTAAAGTPNANPVILDSRGEASIFFSAANYKIVVKDSLDSTIWTQDNLPGDQAATILANLAASTGSSLVGHIASGTGAVATTAQAKLREWVSVKDFGGATVTQKLDTALAAANGNPVLIPADVGPGEPTSWANTDAVWDMRGSDAVGGGRKLAVNFADANGQNLLTLINDLTSYPLSSAANLSLSRATGTLPNARNVEGIQAAAYTIGACSGGGLAAIVSGGEFGGTIASTGGDIGFVWGLHSYAVIGSTATTAVDEVAGIRVTGVVNNSGSLVPSTMFGLIVDDVTGNATAKGAAWIKGKTRIDGDIYAGISSAPNNHIQKISGGGYVLTVQNSANTANDLNLHLVGGVNTNSTTSYPLVVTAGTTDVLYVRGDGNVLNVNNSYGAISDVKLKENITDTTPKLDDLMKVRVVNYNLKTASDKKHIGVIAQELEKVFPSLVEDTPDFKHIKKTREITTPETPAVEAVYGENGDLVRPGIESIPSAIHTEEYLERVKSDNVTKSVKYSIFVPILIKAMQEQQAIIVNLQTRMSAMERKMK